jgi:uncharacterized membrane protein
MPLLAHVKARPRLFVALLFGFALFALETALGFQTETHTRIALAMDAAAILYLATLGHLFATSSHARMLERAAAQDEGAWTIMFLTIGAMLFSVVIVVLEMHGAKDLPTERMAFHLGLAGASIVCAWLVTHASFALHYAHEFYMREGMDFHAGKGYQPTYADFVYQSAVVAVTGATSDVEVNGAGMRQITLVHSLVSYALNMVVLGMTINVVAGLV